MKKCVNCKHLHEPYSSSICRSCDVTDLNVPYRYAKHSKWEPKYEEPDCEKCKHEDKDPEEEPCQECGMLGQNFFEPKEEKKMDNRKTKAQLMEELEQKNTEIAALKKELERSEDYELFVTVGKEMRDAIDGLVAGGLTEEQAFQVLMACALGRI